MGYSTFFNGDFTFDRPLDEATRKLLDGLASTRRVKRDLTKLGLTKSEASKYGEDGEFWFEERDEGKDPSVLDENTPPGKQPGLYCEWLPTEDGCGLQCEETSGDRYREWLAYLIERVLAPRGYVLNGSVTWRGGDSDDLGEIEVKDNVITVRSGTVVYE